MLKSVLDIMSFCGLCDGSVKMFSRQLEGGFGTQGKSEVVKQIWMPLM